MFTPSTKKAKTSLKLESTNSVYSSDAKTKLKNRSPPSEMKSNSRLETSLVLCGISAFRSASPPVPVKFEVPSDALGPTASAASPEVRIMPDSIPIPDNPVLPEAASPNDTGRHISGTEP